MRFRSLLLTLLLSAATLAVLPTANAEPGYECNEKDLHDDLYLRVTHRRDCSLEVVAFEDIICVGGWGDKIERNVQGHTVRAYYCTGGPVPDIATSPAWIGCAQQTYEVNDKVSGVKHTVTSHNYCAVDITLNEGITCVGPWIQKDEYDVAGRVHITNYRCGSPGGDPTVASAAAIAGPSIPPGPIAPCSTIAEERYVGQSRIEIEAGCHINVDLKLYDCVWNCGWETVVDNDAVTVRQYTQQNGQASAAATGCPEYEGWSWAGGFETRSDCTTDVGLIDAYRVCRGSGLDDEYVRQSVGDNNVVVGYCNPLNGAIASLAAAPACNGIWYYSETVGKGENTVTVGTDGSVGCTTVDITTESFPGFACVQPGGPYQVFSIGPVTWYTYC